MNYQEFKTAVIAAAEKAGLQDYELYYATSESTSVDAFQHEINTFSSSLEGGVCFRCIVAGRMGYASTQELSMPMAEDLVRRAMSNAASLETEEKETLVSGGGSYRTPEKKEYPLPGAGELIDAVLRGQDALYAADPSVIDGCASSAAASRDTIAIYNSRGLDLSYENTSALFFSEAVVSDGTEMNNSFEMKLGDLRETNIPELAKKAVLDAKSKLGAGVAPTGAYPVVFAPKAMNSLLGTFSGIFSSETARKGLSRLLGKEGEKIASQLVTLTDDPFYGESAMPIGFDAEGTPTYTKHVIEKGVLRIMLYNMKSAAALGKTSTGNGSKSSYDAPVEVRPFTMVLQPGTLTEEELLKKAGSGVYIDSLGGLHAGANPITGDFSLQSAGYMIEDGVKTRAVRSFTVAGNFYTLLQNIVALSDKAECRSMGMTGYASPAVMVEGLSIAGSGSSQGA